MKVLMMAELNHREWIAVRFAFEDEYCIEGVRLLTELVKDGELSIAEKYPTRLTDKFLTDKSGYDGKITPELAIIVKLKYPELASRMHLSYISDELKNKYRESGE